VKRYLAEARKGAVALATVLAAVVAAGTLPQPAATWVALGLLALNAIGVYAVPNRPAAVSRETVGLPTPAAPGPASYAAFDLASPPSGTGPVLSPLTATPGADAVASYSTRARHAAAVAAARADVPRETTTDALPPGPNEQLPLPLAEAAAATDFADGGVVTPAGVTAGQSHSADPPAAQLPPLLTLAEAAVANAAALPPLLTLAEAAAATAAARGSRGFPAAVPRETTDREPPR